MRHRISRLLAVCFFLSLLIHFGLGPLLVWLFGYHPSSFSSKPEIVYIATSSSIRHAARPRPHPAHIPHPQPVPQPQHAQRKPQQQTPPRPQQQEVRREIARFDRRSIHPPPAHAVTIDAAQQQQMFEKTIAKLRSENNPVVSAARATISPQAPKRFSFDFAGSVGTSPNAQGILTPEQKWQDGPYTYYRVRYWVQYADGSTETGLVPWPIRYLPSQDPFRIGLEHFPLPVPLPDFVLPPGVSLHPLVAFCLKHRYDFPSCPIQHD